ncbi:hypothetical protein GCM10023350_23410 [Nocardioides endophyticus]|uniref:Uncharacterized protein n=1 Tax=Nocardioides endophyticus TaxID=1353775 RepID=A0ABP8YV34_9ACTN
MNHTYLANSADQRALHTTDIETLIEDYYRNIRIPPETVAVLRETLTVEPDRLTASAGQEAAEHLTARRVKNLADQERILDAHLADAITLDQLKTRQGKLRAELDTIDARLAEHHNDYAEARTHIGDCLDLAADIARIYAGCDDQTRRLCNRAFFVKIYIDENRTIRPALAEPFNIILDPDEARDAHTWSAARDAATQSPMSQHHPFGCMLELRTLSAPGRSRTYDLSLRRRLLYPLSYWGLAVERTSPDRAQE